MRRLTSDRRLGLSFAAIDEDAERQFDKRKYRYDKRKRFRLWDGEGYNDENGRHHYCLFGSSDGDIITGRSLGTYECLQFLLEKHNPDVWNVAFAFDYDVNMILRDLDRRHLHVLRKKNIVTWHSFTIEYIPHKWFRVTHRASKTTVRIEDIWSFFGCSFLDACKSYGVEMTSLVSEGKAKRGNFHYMELDTIIIPYWKEECLKGVELIDSLCDSLINAGLKIKRWYGPGVIANYTMRMHDIDQAMGDPSDEVKRAAQYAYAGGRFECFKVGHMERDVYEYDINSAYPYAISKLPNLTNGHWEFVEYPEKIESFGVYCIVSHALSLYKPAPFFARDKKGMVSYPRRVVSWVWGPELQTAMRHVDEWDANNGEWLSFMEDRSLAHLATRPRIKVVCGYVFRANDPGDRPFAWIAETYALRQQYKREGNGAEKALKLQMNSMYGKMAQRIGWNEKTGKPPKWHRLEWAGWVTSHCRAQIMEAAHLAGTNLVSIETDAVFTMERLPLDTGSALGQWEETHFDDFVSLQSGCRFGFQEGAWKAKYRGFDKGSITIENALNTVHLQDSHDGQKMPRRNKWSLTGQTTRFIAFGWAIRNNLDKWRTWETTERELSIGAEGKRIHIPMFCNACLHHKSSIHDCITPTKETQHSYPHHLPWYEGLSDEQLIIDENKWWNV